MPYTYGMPRTKHFRLRGVWRLRGVLLLSALFLYSTNPVRGAQTVIPPRPFVHPSIHSSQQELERMAYRVNFEPGSAARLGWNHCLHSNLGNWDGARRHAHPAALPY